MAQVEKKKKLMYIMENVAENGYDTTKFNKYFSEKYNSSLNVDNMSLEDVHACVADFKNLNAYLNDWADLADFDKQFSNTSPTLLIKESTSCRQIADIFQTEINHKNVKMEVKQYSLKKGGVFSSDTIWFQVETEVPETKFKYLVQRKDSDFYALRKSLVAKYPYIIVPALLQKSTATSQSEANKRQQMYNRFLGQISKSEVLKTSQFLVEFLKVTERQAWKFNKKINEKLKFTKRIEDVLSIDGKASVKESKNSEQFCSQIDTIVAQYAALTQDAISLSKEVHQRSGQLSLIITKLADCFDGLGKFNKKLKIKTQAKLFEKLSDLYQSTSLNLQNQGDLTNIFCGQAMKHYELEYQPLLELQAFRESIKIDTQKQLDKLNEKKNQLMNKDISTWGYTLGPFDELISKQGLLKQNKEEAFKYMLSTDSQKLQEVQEEFQFYTNQAYDECQRVGKNNGMQLIEHFLDQAVIQCDYVQKQRDQWTSFVDYFSKYKTRPVIQKQPRKHKQNDLTFQIKEVDNYKSKDTIDTIQMRSTQDTRIDDGSPREPIVKFSQNNATIIQNEITNKVYPIIQLKNQKSILRQTKYNRQLAPFQEEEKQNPGEVTVIFESLIEQMEEKETIRISKELKEETKDELIPLTHLVQENDFQTFINDQAIKEQRPSIVTDLLNSKDQKILSKEQLERIKFAEMLAFQAKNLQPRKQLELSQKVKDYLQKKQVAQPKIKLNEGMKRQLTKMLSRQIEDSEDSESSDDSE